jgi:hypothetical protein
MNQYFIPAFYVKRQINQVLFRASIGHYHRDYQGGSAIIHEPGKSPVMGSEMVWGLRVGIQQLIGRRKCAVFYAVDLNYAYAEAFQTTENLYYGASFTFFRPSAPHNLSVEKVNFFGVATGIGLRYRVGSHLILSFEPQCRVFYYSGIFENRFYNHYRGFGIAVQPLRISAGFTF